MGLVVILGAAGVLVLAGMLALLRGSYRRVPAGKALIISKMQRTHVTFTGGVVLPVVHSAEEIDLAVKPIAIALQGGDAPHCRDGVRMDMRLCFHVRINATADDVVKVARAVGAARAGSIDTLRELFTAKFCDAVSQVVAMLDHREVYEQRDKVKDHILQVIGQDLDGFVLDDMAIESLRMTPLSELDPDNILDAAGIRKIVEITAQEKVRQVELRRREELEIARQDLDAQRALLQFEQQRIELEARHQLEIDVAQARACVETLRAVAEVEARLAEARGAVSGTVSETVSKTVSETVGKTVGNIDERYRDAAATVERIKAEGEATLRRLDADSRARLDQLDRDSHARMAELLARPDPEST